MKYRTKAMSVEAKQFCMDTKDHVYFWAVGIQANVFHSWDSNDNPILLIPDMNGENEVVCRLGDWLIKDPSENVYRKIHPCDQDTFNLIFQQEE